MEKRIKGETYIREEEGRQRKKQGMNGKEKGVGGSNMGVPKRIPDSPKCPVNELVENIHGFGRIKFYF